MERMAKVSFLIKKSDFLNDLSIIFGQKV